MFETIKLRRDFLRVRGGIRCPTPVCLIEAKQRPLETDGADESEQGAAPARFGFTVTKKLGNAVTRNRIRRRLKAAIAELAPELGLSGFDYVVVARSEALTAPFGTLRAHVARALRRIRKSASAAQ